jgi:ABC-type Na+ efflux pump permease subunit
VDDPATPKNEECDYNALIGGINKIVKYFLYLANFFAIAMFMYAGFLYMFAGDKSGTKEKAKKIFTSVLIGLFFVYSAWLIVYTLLDKLIPDDSKIIPAGQTKDDIIQLK